MSKTMEFFLKALHLIEFEFMLCFGINQIIVANRLIVGIILLTLSALFLLTYLFVYLGISYIHKWIKSDKRNFLFSLQMFSLSTLGSALCSKTYGAIIFLYLFFFTAPLIIKLAENIFNRWW